MKILLTLAVIAGAVLVLRRRRNGAPLPPAASRSSSFSPSNKPLRMLGYGLSVVLILGAGFYLYHSWQDNYQVVRVEVVDSRTGNRVAYQAYKGDLDGRSFLTIEGRQVTLAEVERLEIAAH